MEKKKPKIGLVFFAARWFEEVVLGGGETSREFTKFLNEDTSKVKDALSEDNEVISFPVVTSMEKAWNTCTKLLAEDLDAAVFCFSVWSEDEYLLAFKDFMKIKPSIIWGYTPYKNSPERSNIITLFKNSGIVGTVEGFGTVVKMGAKPFYVFGSSLDKKPVSEINKILRAAKVCQELKTTRLGLLPYRNFQMIITYVDEFRLYSKLGPVVEYISCLQLKKASDKISDDKVKGYVKEIKNKFKIDKRITEDNLLKSAKASLGLEKIINDNKLNGLALSDLIPELHEVMGLRPCLYPESLARSEVVVGNEGDLGGTTAMLILRKLTGNPVMFTEIFNLDYDANTIGTGHAGPSNYLAAQSDDKVTITPDYELMDATSDIGGVWMEFIGKPGRVTILNFICTNDDFQMTILNGESLGGEPRFDGYPHYCIKIDPKMTDFLKSNSLNGTSHHWAVVNGDVKEELTYIADILGIRKVVL
ncbi:MAG: L-arabinose isomerase family protein [Candidatus Humimicrobiaceae bacterium]